MQRKYGIYSSNGNFMGEYLGEDEKEAIQHFVEDAGYENIRAVPVTLSGIIVDVELGTAIPIREVAEY